MAGPLSLPLAGPGGRVDIPGIKLTIDDSRVLTMFALAPGIMAKWMRDAFGQFAGSHRKAILAGLSGGYRRLARKSVFYKVLPTQRGKKAATGFRFSFAPRLEDIRMRIYATSRVTLLHETGGTIVKKGKDMAIPVRGTAGNISVRGSKKALSPAQMSAAGTKFVRRGRLLFEVVQNAKGKERLKLSHLLTGSVHIKPALGIVRTWNSLESDRARRLEINIRAAAAEMITVAAKSVGAVISGALRRIV